MAKLCLITTCMGRLAHLRQALPAAAAQPGCSCVVVDYSCPERCGDWVEQHFPNVRVVRIPNQEFFHRTHARNAGAAVADAPWLCFFDADVILRPHFAERLLPAVQSGHFYLAQPWRHDLCGTVICPRDAFQRIGGFDEVIENFGGEDTELYSRLGLFGLRQLGFPADLLVPIEHDDSLRAQHCSVKAIRVSQTVNMLYRLAKLDLMRLLQKDLPLDERQSLYRMAQQAVQLMLESGQERQWRIPYNRVTSSLGREINCTLVYTVKADQLVP